MNRKHRRKQTNRNTVHRLLQGAAILSGLALLLGLVHPMLPEFVVLHTTLGLVSHSANALLEEIAKFFFAVCTVLIAFLEKR